MHDPMDSDTAYALLTRSRVERGVERYTGSIGHTAQVARDSGACDPLVTELVVLRHDFRFIPELAGRIDALIEIARGQ